MVLSELSCCVFWDTIVTIQYNSCLDSELNHPLRDDEMISKLVIF